jgi:hypothetical protein
MHQVLGRGELDLTYQLPEQVGIDMASQEPYLALARKMEMLLDDLEALLPPETRDHEPP